MIHILENAKIETEKLLISHLNLFRGKKIQVRLLSNKSQGSLKCLNVVHCMCHCFLNF